jgi:hypothetical protein
MMRLGSAARVGAIVATFAFLGAMSSGCAGKSAAKEVDQAQAAATRAEDAARRAEDAASRTEKAATSAEQAASRIERMFQKGLRK